MSLLASACYHSAVATDAKRLRRGPLPGRKMNVERLWREFFTDPTQWWDHRPGKAHPKYPDFKHRNTQQPLWLDNNLTPVWVEAELARMAPGTLQSNIFPWNMRLRSYVKAGNYKKTLDLFQQMQRRGMILDKFTFVPVLNACSGLLALEEGRRIHLEIIKSGLEGDPFVGSCLVDMYAKCGSLEDARRIFNKMGTRDVVSWGALIQGCVKCGEGQEALELFQQMQQEGVDLDPAIFVGVINACSSIGALEQGRRVHEEAINREYESNLYVASSLVDMYAKCGSIQDARRVFDKMRTRDVVSYNILISGYVKCGRGQEALELYQKMQGEGVDLDLLTFVGVLNAIASIGALEEGRQVHEQIIARGYESDLYVASSLVDMYAKCGSIEHAQNVFNEMSTRDAVSWNALILGYVNCGQGEDALELFRLMQRERVEMSPVSFVGILSACASIGALEEGRQAHEQIIDRGYESDASVASSLVDMYSKCGSIEDAQRVFKEMPIKTLFSWSAMLAGYSRHGYVQDALSHFEQMCQEMDVNEVSFISLLSACSHGGLVEEGLHYFESMSTVFNVSPTLEHYACVIDLLGRAGYLHGAEDLIWGMPCEPSASVWMSLLGACKIYGDVEMGERIAKQVLVLGPGDAAGYVLLSNIYASADKLEKVPGAHLES